MFDYTTELFKGYGILDFAHHGGEYQYPTGEMDDSHCTYKWEIKVEINDGNGETRVVNYDAEGSESIINYLSPMIVYPNKFADSITIRIYAYDDRDTPSTPREDLLSRSYEAKFNLQHNESLGISYYIDPDLKPIIPSMMETPF